MLSSMTTASVSTAVELSPEQATAPTPPGPVLRCKAVKTRGGGGRCSAPATHLIDGHCDGCGPRTAPVCLGCLSQGTFEGGFRCLRCNTGDVFEVLSWRELK